MECPSIIHLKRDCGPTESFTAPGAPTIAPSSSPDRLPATEPYPDGGQKQTGDTGDQTCHLLFFNITQDSLLHLKNEITIQTLLIYSQELWKSIMKLVSGLLLTCYSIVIQSTRQCILRLKVTGSLLSNLQWSDKTQISETDQNFSC